MSDREKLEKDYKKINLAIEQTAQEEIRQLQEETEQLKAQAAKIGEAVEKSLNQEKLRIGKKKS